jgi:hypothetical protein
MLNSLGEEEILEAKLGVAESRLGSVVAERDAAVRQKEGQRRPGGPLP